MDPIGPDDALIAGSVAGAALLVALVLLLLAVLG